MERHIETIFCDDVRQEVGGKLSYMGVYSGGLFVLGFPVTLPKLCLVINILTPTEKPFGKLVLRVLTNENVLIEEAFDETQCTVWESANNLLIFRSIFVLSPCQIEGPCVLRVRAETEEGELKGPGLIIGQAPAESNQAG